MSGREKLKEIFESYESLKEICNDAKEQSKRNNRFAIRVIPFLGKSKKPKLEHHSVIADYFDSLNERIKDHYILELIAAFEHIIFKRFENTSGEIKTIVKKQQSLPPYRSSFIKTEKDIHNLSGAREILESQISGKLYDNLKEITDHRNWLSHGKRRDVGKESLLSIEDIYEILTEIIEALR
jgi:hypothetical protein